MRLELSGFPHWLSEHFGQLLHEHGHVDITVHMVALSEYYVSLFGISWFTHSPASTASQVFPTAAPRRVRPHRRRRAAPSDRRHAVITMMTSCAYLQFMCQFPIGHLDTMSPELMSRQPSTLTYSSILADEGYRHALTANWRSIHGLQHREHY